MVPGSHPLSLATMSPLVASPRIRTGSLPQNMSASSQDLNVGTARAYYSSSIADFLDRAESDIVAALTLAGTFALELTQRDAWVEQIHVLQEVLPSYRNDGWIAFEFSVPRVGKRIDVLIIIQNVIFVLEFKAWETEFKSGDRDQVWDYALDLKNFHSTSHGETIAPILIATLAKSAGQCDLMASYADSVLEPINATPGELSVTIERILNSYRGSKINIESWNEGRYQPTPTIIEAAKALYGNHSVLEISRSDASAKNLARTSSAIGRIIRESRDLGQKSICFVTGVPGAGKTLVGLNVATEHTDQTDGLHSVFLSGNGPLVDILREALARDQATREIRPGVKPRLGEARRTVKAFIQNVHHFRDEYLKEDQKAPIDHVTIFDEAQRAWNWEQAASFMKRKRGLPDFRMSEPEFLISCMDRHRDWAVIVCLVGGGQEIHTGEAGIGEWLRAIVTKFSDWKIHISPHLSDSEYEAGDALTLLEGHSQFEFEEDLHLAVSMRSFRAEKLSGLVKQILDLEISEAKNLYNSIHERYPIMLTRDVGRAKSWLRSKARGSERYGIMVSSQAQRLKPLAIDIRASIDPVHWFLNSKDDVRSSYYLEDVGTEFHVQGLELDWACVVWDGDFRKTKAGWQHWSFKGNRWERINKIERQAYLKNAYRVLLTRARQGMVIVVPEGDPDDPTRDPEYYSETFEYLRSVGLKVI